MTNKELNAAVAEKVIGWKVCKDPNCPAGCDKDVSVTEDGIIEVAGKVWSPSTDISAAWEVVEKMRASRYEIVLDDLGGDSQWRCRWDRDDCGCVGTAEHPSAPMAICLSALKALESK